MFYNDPKYNYKDYWEGRDYENRAEILAIKRLLTGKSFSTAVDVGGGYGRLCVLLENYAKKVILAEPSQQQLDIAKEFLKDHPRIESKLMVDNKLDFGDKSVDLVTLIRVMHHLPDPSLEFKEIHRVLGDNGYFVMEFANNAHFKNRLKFARIPLEPVDIRSQAHKDQGTIPFVDHNPKTVLKQLKQAGFRVERTLSVSNLRSPMIKKIVPGKLMLIIESLIQIPMAKMYFGPSIFLLARKNA